MGKITPVASSSKPTTAGIGEEGGAAAAWLDVGDWPPSLKAAVKSLDNSSEDKPVEGFGGGKEGLMKNADTGGVLGQGKSTW